MALHGNDQSHFSRGEGVTSDNSLLNNTASLFHNVNIGSHMSTYPLDPYNHQNTSFILRSFSNRSDLTLPHCYAIGPENNSDNNHIAGGGDFPPRPSTSHTNNPSDGSAHDIFGDRSQGTAGHVVRTRRRKAGGDDGTSRLCVVCEEPASGYNFDRLTCESCKAFFRRNALKPKDKIKACSRNGDCVVVGSQRKHCPSCRLEKCLAVGMKKELILPPEKLEQRAKPKRRRQNTNTDEASTSGPGPSTIMPFGTHGGGGGFSQPPTLHPQVANLVGSRVPPSQFGPSEAHDFMSTRNLNNLFNDMASSRGAQGQIPLFDATMKLHFAMGGGNGAGGVPSESSFDPSSSMPDLHPSLPPPPPTESGNQFVGGPPLPPPTSNQVSTGVLPTAPSFLNEGPFSSLQPAPTISNSTETSSGLIGAQPCRRTNFTMNCHHIKCRRSLPYQHRRVALDTVMPMEPDRSLLSCLHDCVSRIREPFSPDEPLDTQAAVTLEQEYNRMDICIRRIIRVVKMLPYFNEIGKPAQLGLLRANIYGMIVLYSSFFFERNIRKLRYPVKDRNGALSSVTVSMLDDISTPEDEREFSSFQASVNLDRLKEDFELYKTNTMAAFNHLEELTGTDDVLRMALLAIKLFTEDSVDESIQKIVASSRRVYLFFLWNYLRWRAGPKHVREASELFTRLHLAFVDLRSLEIRMTEFAKLVSLDGLSPLMREICSSNNGSSASGNGGAEASGITENTRPIPSGTMA